MMLGGHVDGFFFFFFLVPLSRFSCHFGTIPHSQHCQFSGQMACFLKEALWQSSHAFDDNDNAGFSIIIPFLAPLRKSATTREHLLPRTISHGIPRVKTNRSSSTAQGPCSP
jgi:hypothetical protein